MNSSKQNPQALIKGEKVESLNSIGGNEYEVS
jgi:hypothetical protein